MNLSEFKAWFDGFTESMEGKPTDKQWKRIKEQVKKIDGTATSYPVYIDRYWRRPWNEPYWTYLSAMSTCETLAGSKATLVSSKVSEDLSNNFDSVAAMYAAGKAEALSS